MSGWDCRCGLHNRALTDKCAACGGFRVNMDKAVLPEPFSDPRTTPEVCLVCGRAPAAYFGFARNRGLVFMRRRFVYQGRFCKSCATGSYRAMQTRNITEGWFGVISFFATIVYAVRNLLRLRRGRRQLEDPAPADPSLEKALRGRPVALQLLLHPSAWIAVAVVALAVVLAITLTGDAAPSPDKTFVSSLSTLHSSRNALITLANTRSEAWKKNKAPAAPGPEDLVADELAALETRAAAVPAPSSPELLALRQAWEARLAALAAAESRLAASYTADLAKAEAQAWTDEASAYRALATYAKEHE
jgi:hypothetical protein